MLRIAYRANLEVLGIFPVAAYNGGPRNVAKLTLLESVDPQARGRVKSRARSIWWRRASGDEQTLWFCRIDLAVAEIGVEPV